MSLQTLDLRGAQGKKVFFVYVSYCGEASAVKAKNWIKICRI